MKLVMIHGRGQAGKDVSALKKEWLDALTYGFARANRTPPSGLTVEFPFYGDELETLINQVGTPLASDVTAKGIEADDQQDLRGEILRELAGALGVADADIQREYSGDPLQKGPQNWEWVQAILRAVDRIPGVNSSFIDVFTRDVYAYLTVPGIRMKIDSIVRNSIGAEPCVVIAHSLGTVVAYNVLGERPATPKYPGLVTVGSPLGIKGIRRQLKSPVKFPLCMNKWFNAFDDRDVVALYPLDINNFNVDPVIENYDGVKNFTDNRHGITGYLSDPVVASKIADDF